MANAAVNAGAKWLRMACAYDDSGCGTDGGGGACMRHGMCGIGLAAGRVLVTSLYARADDDAGGCGVVDVGAVTT